MTLLLFGLSLFFALGLARHHIRAAEQRRALADAARVDADENARLLEAIWRTRREYELLRHNTRGVSGHDRT